MSKFLRAALAGFVLIAILFGCGQASTSSTTVKISELEYKQALGKAVCETVKELNNRGELADEAAIARDFDPLLQQAVLKQGYSTEDWLAAKAKYFPNEEEHTKLVKMHFTWCLIQDSIGK